MSACIAGMEKKNQKRLEKFVELYYQPVFRFASRLCGSPAVAMLLTQRAFRAAKDRSKELPVPTNVRVWLFTILFNDYLEHRSRRVAA
jgi:DNA-directed RNA polymerase specialized sigma24 family protein